MRGLCGVPDCKGQTDCNFGFDYSGGGCLVFCSMSVESV